MIAGNARKRRVNLLVVIHKRQKIPKNFRAHNARELNVFVVPLIDGVVKVGEHLVELMLDGSFFLDFACFATVNFLIWLRGFWVVKHARVDEKIEWDDKGQRTQRAVVGSKTPIDCESLLAFFTHRSIGISLVFQNQRVQRIFREVRDQICLESSRKATRCRIFLTSLLSCAALCETSKPPSLWL